jgi:hypothetical protein
VTPVWDIKRLCWFLAVSESDAYNLLAKEALAHLNSAALRSGKR